MTLAGQKRKFTSIADDITLTTRNTPLDVEATILESTNKVVKKRKKKEVVVVESVEEHPASKFKTPTNPQATFEGLPAELRLQIYDYLCDSTIVHVHKHGNDVGPPRFTWTPCRSPNPKSPLLCANPKWSGMCKEEDRCTYKLYAPPEPVGFWALAASNKHIRNEAQEFFLRRTVISIHPENLESWLDHLVKHAPRQIDHLRRITLAGPNTYRCVVRSQVQLLRKRVPNLEGVGFQSQDPIWRWVRSYANDNVQVDSEAWRRWNILEWMQSFDSSVTIALEAIVCCKYYRVEEQQIAVRMLREGKTDREAGSAGWDDGDVEVEIEQPGKLAESKRNAKWRAWWRGKDLKGLA